MDKKYYFKVQDVKKTPMGHRTYSLMVEDVTLYRIEDVKKAVRHFMKRKANDIILCSVEYLDDMPYVKTQGVFGYMETDWKTGERRISFGSMGKCIPLSTKELTDIESAEASA